MIRQFFVNKVTIICTMIFMVSCSTDSVKDDADIEEIVTKKVSPSIKTNDTIEVLIEWRQGTSERHKNRIRKNYRKKRILLQWEGCDIKGNEDVEVWLIDFSVYIMYRPAPLTDPDKEDMDRVTFYANCKDYLED